MIRWGRNGEPASPLARALALGRWNPLGSLRGVPFVVFDTETTGFHPYAGDEVIALGAVRMDTGEQFDTLVNPRRSIPQMITDLTGIDDRAVAAAPTLDAVLEPFLQFVGRSVMVAHCADFDRAFLEARLRKCGRLRWAHPLLDTQALAQRLFPTWRDYRLEHCASRLETPVVARHTALGDAQTTAAILTALLDECERRGLDTWERLQGFLLPRVW